MTAQPGLCGTWSKTPKTGFLTTRLIYRQQTIKRADLNVQNAPLLFAVASRRFFPDIAHMIYRKVPKFSMPENFAVIYLKFKQRFLVWFGSMVNVQVNNFSVMLGRSHHWYYQYFFGGKYVLLKDTTQ